MKYYAQYVNIGKHYSKDGVEFDYLKPDDFKDTQEKTNAKVIGSVCLKETNKNNVDVLIINSNNKTFQYEVENDTSTSGVMGYVLVFDNTYIAIKKDSALPLPVFIVGLCILAILIVMFFPTKNGTMVSKLFHINDNNIPNAELNIADGQDWDGELPQNGEITQPNQESIEIPGYAELYLKKDTPEVQLINPENNTVYFVYTIKDENNNVIAETDAIAPNKMVSVNLFDKLETGDHKLFFAISTYDIETQTPCNGATQEVIIHIGNKE